MTDTEGYFALHNRYVQLSFRVNEPCGTIGLPLATIEDAGAGKLLTKPTVVTEGMWYQKTPKTLVHTCIDKVVTS